MDLKKLSDLVEANRRLDTSLEILGVTSKDPKHYRHNLISAIALYAGAKGDSELEKQCLEEMSKIRNEP